MITARHIGLLLCLILASSLSGQQRITFMYNDIDKALHRAKVEKKYVFVDTYAPWCIPCKRLDENLKDKQLVKYFNRHFVNIKVNMDVHEVGTRLRSKYSVVFLPTIMFLDNEGNMRFQVDKVLSSEELLSKAKLVNETDGYFLSEATAVHFSPFEKKTKSRSETKTTKKKPYVKVTPDIATSSKTNTPRKAVDEKILHVLGATDAASPEGLYREAYFRMELMDGSHKETARQYLSTQIDWSTDKNIRFINDFLNSTESDEFEYFVDNRARFEEVIGIDQYLMTSRILINKTLFQRMPRPSLEEARSLLQIMDKENGSRLAYEYYLDRLHLEGKNKEYTNLAERYLTKFNNYNEKIVHRLVIVSLSQNPDNKNLKRCANLTKELLKIDPEESEYFMTMAEIEVLRNNKNRALEYATTALTLSQSYNSSDSHIRDLIKRIEEL